MKKQLSAQQDRPEQFEIKNPKWVFWVCLLATIFGFVFYQARKLVKLGIHIGGRIRELLRNKRIKK